MLVSMLYFSVTYLVKKKKEIQEDKKGNTPKRKKNLILYGMDPLEDGNYYTLNVGYVNLILIIRKYLPLKRSTLLSPYSYPIFLFHSTLIEVMTFGAPKFNFATSAMVLS